jgi:O-antigen/teichoic acid export membrane protein
LAESDVLDSSEAGGLILRGGILRGAGFGAGIVLSLIGVIFVTRHLGPERYGRFQTILNLLIVVQSVTDVGMATLGVREFSQLRGAERDRFMRVLLGLRLVLTAVGVCVAVGIAVAADYPSSLIVGTLLGGVGLVLTVAQTTLAIPLGVQLRIGVVTAMDVTRQALTAALFVALALAGAGILPFLAVVVPVQFILLVWTIGLVRGTVSLRPSADFAAWRKLLTASVSFALAIAVGTIYQYVAQVLTSFLASERETGLFSASFRTYIVVTAVPGVLVSTAFPLLSRAARDDRARLVYALRKLTDAMAIMGVAISLAMILGAPTIIRVIAGDMYLDATPVLRVHGVALLLAFAITTWGFGLLSLHRHRPMIVANGIAFVVTTVGVLLLTPSHGAVGTAWASVLGESVLAVGYLVALRQTARDLRPAPRVPVSALLVGLIVGGLVVLSGAPSVVAAVVAPTLYLVVVVSAGLVPQELIDVLPASLRSRLRGSA